MVDQVQDTSSICTDSDFDVIGKVETFRLRLKVLNQLYRELVDNHVVGSFYIGQNKTFTHLPDDAKFERTNVERF